jgi:hypothetical protein
MPDEFKYDVFLSHSAKDKAVVRPVAELLRKDGLLDSSFGFRVSEFGFPPLAARLSANTFGCDWTQLQGVTFRFRDPLNKERRFIPPRLDDAPIKGSLGQFLYIGWRPTDVSRAEQGTQKWRRSLVRDAANPRCSSAPASVEEP